MNNLLIHAPAPALQIYKQYDIVYCCKVEHFYDRSFGGSQDCFSKLLLHLLLCEFLIINEAKMLGESLHDTVFLVFASTPKNVTAIN